MMHRTYLPIPPHRPVLLAMILLLIVAATGCQNLNRSMIFSTGTTVGLEISTSPASDTPLQLVFGMKRAEILIDPVLGGADSDTIQPQAHSVIAKLAGQIEQSRNSGMSGAQWFASGRAAEHLAAHPATAAALTDSPDIARTLADAATRTYGPAPDPAASAIQSELLLMYLQDDLRDPAAAARFDRAARAAGFSDFAAFILGNPTQAQARQLRETLATDPAP